MNGTTVMYRPSEGPQDTSPTHEQTVHFSNTFGGHHEAIEHQPIERERTKSRDYSVTDEWDASKVPPSRFQQRKGSIYATPASRDGHVQRNRDNDAEFHKKHSKKFSLSKAKEKVEGAMEGHRRKSSADSKNGEHKSHGTA